MECKTCKHMFTEKKGFNMIKNGIYCDKLNLSKVITSRPVLDNCYEKGTPNTFSIKGSNDDTRPNIRTNADSIRLKGTLKSYSLSTKEALISVGMDNLDIDFFLKEYYDIRVVLSKSSETEEVRSFRNELIDTYKWSVNEVSALTTNDIEDLMKLNSNLLKKLYK